MQKFYHNSEQFTTFLLLLVKRLIAKKSEDKNSFTMLNLQKNIVI